MTLTYKQLLTRNRSFRLLWGGQVVSELGNWFNFVAGLGLVRSVSMASPEAAAIILVSRLAPFSIFAPFAGAFVDRWSRRYVMIAADLARAFIALGFLLVRGPGDLWIAYVCTAISALLTAFFEAAKSAAMPNIAKDEGLLAGNALMFSSRFLLMTVGAALGGATAASLGYNIAFMVNAVSFLISAWSIFLIPEAEVKIVNTAGHHPVVSDVRRGLTGILKDIREGWQFIRSSRIVGAMIGVNVLWAIGGGATYLIVDRLGGVLFAHAGGFSPDGSVAVLYSAAGLGLFIGMMLARKAGAYVEAQGVTIPFIGWMLLLHGVLFAMCGIVPTLMAAAACIFASRAVIGVEFGIQDTLLMRSIPDKLRGRVAITDRAAEILVMSMSTAGAGWALNHVSIRTVAVISGLLAGIPGIFWLIINRSGAEVTGETVAG